ncbi:MAG: hypothetical protein M3Y93_02280, partial [Pseudomonadota bacterium]|nr:hypothetical protein [Pseudomonadota bacterium]
GFGGRGENSPVREQIPDGSPVHSGSMDQESAGIWTAQADSQTGQPKSDRLLGARDRKLRHWQQAEADQARYDALMVSGAVARSAVEQLRTAAVTAQANAQHSRAEFAVSRDAASVTRAR